MPPAESSSNTPETKPIPGWRRSDQVVIASLLVVILGLLSAQLLRLNGWGSPLIEIDRLPERRYDYRIDINQAGWVEWTQLEGIGETLAQRIVADRELHGPFRSIEDLSRVDGIGPKTIERLRPFLFLSREK